MKEIIHAANESLDTIIKSITLELYEISNYDNIRILSKNKPGCIIICVEADVSNNIAKYIKRRYSSVNSINLNDITFESTVFDYLIIKENHIPETNKLEILTIGLLDMVMADSLMSEDNESDLKDTDNWSLTSKEFTVIEIDVTIAPTEINLNNDLNNSDMKIFG